MRWDDRIGRRLKLSDLHVLLTVAQCGSMAKAANQLAVSHPVVSRSISGLEHILGVRLLDRNPHGVELTDFGRAILDRSHAAFNELRQGVRDVEFLANPTAGEVRIASPAPLAASFVSGVIDRLSRRYPRITFDVIVADTAAMGRHLSARDVDLLIARKFAPLPEEEWNFEYLYEDPYVVVAGANNRLVRRRHIELAELVNEPWVLPPANSQVGSLFATAFRNSGFDFPHSTVIAYAYEVRTSLLATGRFLTVFPVSVLTFPSRHRSLRMLPVSLSLPHTPVGVMTLKNRTPSPVAQLFIACAREIAQSPDRRK